MAIEPKTPRKRAVKKVAEISPVIDTSAAPASLKKSASKKSSPKVPVPIFQAAQVEAKPARATRASKQTKAKIEVNEVVHAATQESPSDSGAGSESDTDSRGRRRRRGGRGRRRPGSNTDETNENSSAANRRLQT